MLLAADGPRVIDFGISRALDGTAITGTGTVIGTPGFMSPEHTTGKAVSPASDVFSFGGVLAFAATGSGAFGDGTAMAMMYRVVHGEPELAGLPDELRDLVRSCLAKQPEDRPTLAALMEIITTKLASVPPAMTFWPQALADYIDSYRARLISSWGPESSPRQEDIATTTAERPDTQTPPPDSSTVSRSRRRPRRYQLIAGAGLLAAAALITVIILPASAPPVASGPKSTLTIEASYISADSMPSASPRVTVSTDGSSPAVLGAPAKVRGTHTIEWTDTVHARSVRVCIKPPPGWTVAGQSCSTLTEPGAPALLFPLSLES